MASLLICVSNFVDTEIGMCTSRDLTTRQLGGLAESGIEQIRVVVLPDGRMDRASTAAYIGCAPQTLASWAVKKIGPRPIRVGGKTYYRKAEVDRFIASGEEPVRLLSVEIDNTIS